MHTTVIINPTLVKVTAWDAGDHHVYRVVAWNCCSCDIHVYQFCQVPSKAVLATCKIMFVSRIMMCRPLWDFMLWHVYWCLCCQAVALIPASTGYCSEINKIEICSLGRQDICRKFIQHGGENV